MESMSSLVLEDSMTLITLKTWIVISCCRLLSLYGFSIDYIMILVFYRINWMILLILDMVIYKPIC